jgi:hypothetical protein
VPIVMMYDNFFLIILSKYVCMNFYQLEKMLTTSVYGRNISVPICFSPGSNLLRKAMSSQFETSSMNNCIYDLFLCFRVTIRQKTLLWCQRPGKLVLFDYLLQF